MRSEHRTRDDLPRVRAAQVLMLAALALLGLALWRIQVLRSAEYASSGDRQSMRRVRLPGVRGRVLDRDGVCLADNRPSYCIALYIEELRQPGKWNRTIDEVERVLDELALRLRMPRGAGRAEIGRHIARRLPLPFLAWRDIDAAALARWAECADAFPGVDVYVEPVRVYPHRRLASHVLGYVGRSRSAPGESGEEFDYYLPEMEGVAGVESAFDAHLRGQAGGRLLRVDASGFRRAEEGGRPARPGRDVRLALDVRIQATAEQALAGARGACVVLDTRNGDVLAMASSPDFDPNALSPEVLPAVWEAVSGDPENPLFNRAVSGAYAPGSTFKPLVALAALENRRAAADTVYACAGQYLLGDLPLRCWRETGHGEIAMRKAIEQSCNCYFYQLGLDCGYSRICHMAAAVGFGRRTGIELPGEAPGLLPDNEWKMRRRHDRWRAGDTCNASIGQGALATTPLQMAVFAAALANGGDVLTPRLVIDPPAGSARAGGPHPGQPANRLHWSSAALDTVRGGMLDVVHAPTGTGKRALVPGLRMAGKTGTAEFGSKAHRRNYAWMIAFAPFDEPRYAMALLVEEGVSGGITAAPRVRALMAGIFGLSLEPEGGNAGA